MQSWLQVHKPIVWICVDSVVSEHSPVVGWNSSLYPFVLVSSHVQPTIWCLILPSLMPERMDLSDLNACPKVYFTKDADVKGNQTSLGTTSYHPQQERFSEGFSIYPNNSEKKIYIISYLRCSAASDSPKPSRPRHEHAWNILKPWHVPPTSTNIHQLPTNCCRCRTDVEQSILAHFHYFSSVSKWPAFLFNPPNQEVSGSGQKLPPRRYMSERPLAGWAYWPLNGALAAVVAIGVSPYFGRWTYGDFIQNIQKKGGSTVQPDQAQCLETGEMDMTWLYPMDQSWNLNRIMRIWTDMPL